VAGFDQRIDWFSLQNGDYMTLLPEEDGVICSRPSRVMVRCCSNAGWHMPVCLQSGINSAEHQAFVQRLQMLNPQGLSECSDGKRQVRTLSLFEETA